MAKRSKKKTRKETKKNQKASQLEVIYDDEQDTDPNEGGENITSEEEEEERDGDERKRQKLLEAISALGGKRKKKFGERSEAAIQMSEFTINAQGKGDKINLSDLIGTMEKTPAVSSSAKKQLRKLQQGKNTIECPVSKQVSERIQRNLAFQKAAAEVSRWNGIITQNQKAEQLIFPLNQEPSGPKTMERVVTGWKAQTPLEQEVFALLSANNQPINDPILTPAEEASLKAMSLEEAKIRRAELQKARALQSYYEAKTRRERKIKSKKYHKVHNKNKGKTFLKQFEDMVKTDPSAALEELNKMEMARMQERMSLKHQNSGKWAKSKVIMAKYDEGARKAMQQQLELNKELTHKLVTSLNKEEEEDAGEEEIMPSLVNDAEMPDPSNPWMRGKLSEDHLNDENMVVHVTSEEAGAPENTTEEDVEIEETEEETLLREFNSRRKLRQCENSNKGLVISVDDKEEDHEVAAEKLDASDIEEAELSEFTSILRGLAHSHCEAEAAASSCHSDTQWEKPLEGLKLLGPDNSVTDIAPAQPYTPPPIKKIQPSSENQGKKRKRKRGIELTEVLTKDTNSVQVPLIPTVEDTEDTNEKMDQRFLIKEAFAGDDVVSDFLRDKKKQEEDGKPKVVDLTLPGWGEWGGIGLKPSRKKSKRFRIKAAPPLPRKDQHLPTVIISEKRNSCISSHQVNLLPFPFESHLQFESTMRSPLGRTWNTERTIKKLTKPKVVTRLGTIIEPMAQEEMMKDGKTEERHKASSESSVVSCKKRRKNAK